MTTYPKALFRDRDLHSVLLSSKERLFTAADRVSEADLLAAPLDDLADEILVEHAPQAPVLRENDQAYDFKSTKVDVRDDHLRAVSDRSRPCLVDGTEYNLFVPFDGDAGLFDCRPSRYSTMYPRAHVRGSELVFVHATPGAVDAKNILPTLTRELGLVRQYLSTVQSDVQRFNSSARGEVRARLEQRASLLRRNHEVAAAIGIPLRRRSGAQPTYRVPSVQRKVRPQSAASPSSMTSRPEPVLVDDEYEHILDIIESMAHVMERSPSAFKSIEEEDLRTHFLVQLNGQYEGQATGETFNYEGKTDLLIRHEGKNIFIAECKFWSGEKALRATIDQLLGYVSWRDTKTAIILFSRLKNFSTVLDGIPTALRAHPSYVRDLPCERETAFRCVARHRDDEQRHLVLTVLAFNVPK